MTGTLTWHLGHIMLKQFNHLLHQFRIPSISAQCRSMSIKIVALILMSINANQFLSMPINARSSRIDPALISIERNWSELIGNDRHWEAFLIDRHWEELRGIDRHWSAMIGIERHLGSIDRGSPEHQIWPWVTHVIISTMHFPSIQWIITGKLYESLQWDWPV